MTEIEVTLVKVFSPEGKPLRMWPTNTRFKGDAFDFKREIRKSCICKLILREHPEIKEASHLQIDINIKALN